MMRLANSSRVAANSGPAASVLPDALSNFQAVSNAAAKRSLVSGSKAVFASNGIIDTVPLLTGGSTAGLSATDACFEWIGDPELCAYWYNLASPYFRWEPLISMRRGRSHRNFRFFREATASTNMPEVRAQGAQNQLSPERRAKSARTAAISFCRRGSCAVSVAAKSLRR